MTSRSIKSFRSLDLDEVDTLWLSEACTSHPFDVRLTKLKLLGRIPKGYDPNRIDSRFYRDGKPTILALRRFVPDNPLFELLDQTIRFVREEIQRNPGLNSMGAGEVARALNRPQPEVERLFGMLITLGRFSPGGSSANPGEYNSLNLSGDYGYDEYLSYENIDELLDRVFARDALRPAGPSYFAESNPVFAGGGPAWTLSGEFVSPSPIRENTAFVIMAMDPSRPELQDVHLAIKETCSAFGIVARRADEIEHQDTITDVILNEIRTCEHLIADLSLERPNVYYEVGFAHAIKKRPILYRKHGTALHFDLSVHNVPEYRNITELRENLKRRLEAILGRSIKAT